MKSRIAMVASVLALTGLALAGSACGTAGEAYLGAMATARSEAIATESPEVTGRLGRDKSVLHEVTGDANGVTITLVNETGGINQGDYTLPYRYWARFPQDTHWRTGAFQAKPGKARNHSATNLRLLMGCRKLRAITE